MDTNLRKFFVISIIGLFLFWIVTRYNILIGPLVIGALIAFLLDPIVSLLKKKLKISQNISVSLVFLAFLVVMVTLVWALTPVVIQQGKSLTNEMSEIAVEVIKLQPWVEKTLQVNLPLEEIVADIEREVNQFADPDRLFRVILNATSNIIWLLVILVTSYTLLRDWAKLKQWIVDQFPTSNQWKVIQFIADLQSVWDTYLRGQLIMMLVIGVLSGIGGIAVGLSGAVYIGLLAGALAIIPSLGPAIATITAGLIAWTDGSAFLAIPNFWFMVLVVGIFVGIQFAEGLLLYPRIMGRKMKLPPTVIFIAVVSTLSVMGALYGLIIVPIIGSVIVILRYAREWL